MSNRLQLTGAKYGRLTVIKFAYIKKHHTYWECRCECGNTKVINSSNLQSGNSNSCGCLELEQCIKRNKELYTTHGMTKSRFYKIWVDMKSRCIDKNSISYKYYGQRKIKLNVFWHIFDNFKNDMYESYLKHVEEYGEKQTTIDRIDNYKGYIKENCRWQTYTEQCNNKRNNRIIEYKGEKITLSNLATKYNVKYKILFERLKLGWNVERAITEPIHIEFRRKTSI